MSHFPVTFIERLYYWLKLTICAKCHNDTEKKRIRKAVDLIVETAPEPNDLKWENLELTTNQRRTRIFLITLFVVLILGISCIALLAVSVLQNQLITANSKNAILQKVISFGFAAVISLFNWIISKVMIKFTIYERNVSQSEYLLSLSVKLLIFSFINTGPIPVLVNYLSGNWDYKNILVTNALFTFIINSIFSPIFYLSNPFHWLKLIQRKMIEKKMKEDENYINGMTQGELNS